MLGFFIRMIWLPLLVSKKLLGGGVYNTFMSRFATVLPTPACFDVFAFGTLNQGCHPLMQSPFFSSATHLFWFIRLLGIAHHRKKWQT